MPPCRRPDRVDAVGMRKIILVSLAIVTVSLGFIASYSAALRARRRTRSHSR